MFMRAQCSLGKSQQASVSSMFISYNEACARDCSTLEQDLVLCEKAGFDYIEIRLDMLTDYLKRHTVEELAAFFCTSRLKPHAFNALYLYPEFLSEGDDEARQKELLEEFRLGCEVGRAIGRQPLLYHCAAASARPGRRPVYRQLGRHIFELCAYPQGAFPAGGTI